MSELVYVGRMLAAASAMRTMGDYLASCPEPVREWASGLRDEFEQSFVRYSELAAEELAAGLDETEGEGDGSDAGQLIGGEASPDASSSSSPDAAAPDASGEPADEDEESGIPAAWRGRVMQGPAVTEAGSGAAAPAAAPAVQAAPAFPAASPAPVVARQAPGSGSGVRAQAPGSGSGVRAQAPGGPGRLRPQAAPARVQRRPR